MTMSGGKPTISLIHPSIQSCGPFRVLHHQRSKLMSLPRLVYTARMLQNCGLLPCLPDPVGSIQWSAHCFTVRLCSPNNERTAALRHSCFNKLVLSYFLPLFLAHAKKASRCWYSDWVLESFTINVQCVTLPACFWHLCLFVSSFQRCLPVDACVHGVLVETEVIFLPYLSVCLCFVAANLRRPSASDCSAILTTIGLGYRSPATYGPTLCALSIL